MAALKGSSQDDLVDKNGKSLTGRARERAARERSTEVLRLAGRDGAAWGDEYGAAWGDEYGAFRPVAEVEALYALLDAYEGAQQAQAEEGRMESAPYSSGGEVQ